MICCCRNIIRICLILWTFYEHIKYIVADISWLLEVKTHLDKLERYDEHLPFFKFKYDFNAFCYSKFPDFENIYILLTMNKGSGVFRTSSSSQVSQGESAVRDFVKSEGEENKIISSAGNTPDIEENHDNSNTNNIAKYKGERLKGKFVSSNVINVSRRNLSESEISLLSKGLKFVPIANKIDREQS